MEKAAPSTEAIVTTLVDVTPKQLREIANLLELSTQRASGTETVLVNFTDKITFAYRPSQKSIDRLMEKLQSVGVRQEEIKIDPKTSPSPQISLQ